MCGILGVISTTNVKPFNLRSAGDSLSHRGPDDEGDWISSDGRVWLAHRRLSILDLSPLGHQPMHLPELGLSIVFNGEIYNYRDLRRELQTLGHDFRSNSDTEVLLAAYAQWGCECLSRLNGMFALAIFDARRQKLLLARDRAGEKPLFYRINNNTLYFASELKALLIDPSQPRQISVEALDCYLTFGYVPGERCILEGYNKLPAAHALTFDLKHGFCNVWCYWQLPELDSTVDLKDEIMLLDQLETLLEDAVGRQLVADVPVGVLLSGGLDSSLITAMAVRHSDKVNTFSIGFPGYGKFDETSHARLISQHFGTKHIELVAEPTIAHLLPMLVKQFDEPLVDSSMFPTWLISNLVRKHCTVALGGDGGDELFGGYNHYRRLLMMQQNLKYVPRWISRAVSNVAKYWLPVGFKGRNYLQVADVDFNNGLPLVAIYFDASTRRKLMSRFTEYRFVAESILADRTPVQGDLLQRATRMDFQNFLADDILVKVDRASMMNSLEIRAPMLDYRLVEFAFGKVPSNLKATTKEQKILLKRLAARVLPPEFDKHRKQGFSIPISDWLRSGVLREIFWDTLTSRECIFDSSTVQRLLNGQDRGRSNGERLFALVQFELWRKMYKAHV